MRAAGGRQNLSLVYHGSFMTRLPRTLSIAALILLAVIVAVITLAPMPLDRPLRRIIITVFAVFNDIGLRPRLHYSLFEHFANVGLFVPVGVLLAKLLPHNRWWVATIVAFVGSVGVETVQALALPDRTASPTDVVLNTVGALGGAMTMHIIYVVRQKDRRSAAAKLNPTA